MSADGGQSTRELETLLAAVSDGTPSRAQWQRLAEILKADPSARTTYRQYMTVHALLETELQVPLEPIRELGAVSAAGRESAWWQGRGHWRVLAAAAVVTIVTLFALSQYLGRGHATIAANDGARWAGQSTGPVSGARLETGSHEIQGGTVRLSMDSGAQVAIAGPAKFEVTARGTMYLASGQVFATVPHNAIGFAISTPGATVVDLGTEFGVSVGTSGETHVQVLTGKVKVEPKGAGAAAAEMLSAGEARSVGPEGKTLAPAAFNPQTVEFAAGAKAVSRYARWMGARRELEADPSTLALYRFERDERAPAVLRNGARSDRQPVGSDGVIENAQWTAGRFPGKTALKFGQPGGGVRVNIPGDARDVTAWAWINVDDVSAEYQSLFASDQWDRPGPFHWNVVAGGQMDCGTWTSEPLTRRWRSAQPMATPLGEWLFVAVVYQHGGTVKFYRNGELVDGQDMPNYTDTGFTIGNARIGNWLKEPRPFAGTIDELGLLSRPMSDGEIRELYVKSRP